MPTQTFTSPEAHVAACQNINLRMSLVGTRSAPWTMSELALHDVKLQWAQVGAGNVVEGAVTPGTALIYVPTQNVRVMRMNGRRFDAQTFSLLMPGDELCLSSTDRHDWFCMAVPQEMLAEWSGIDTPAIPRASRFIELPWERAEAFRRVVAQLGSIVQRAPAAFESSLAIETTARKLMESVRETMFGQPTTTTQPGRHSIPRRQIIRMVMDSIDQRDREYLTVADLASAAGVSERTLRAAFQEYFGMGPVRYLRLRTLNLVNKALQNTDPSVTTVTGVATQFGIWELGRLAHDYQLLFGELPSETLRHGR
jgi:AraC family transcriptional regulator, ethanolamine operon transcriptional activator